MQWIEIQVGEFFDITHIRSIHTDIKQAIAQSSNIQLNLKNVERVDSTGIQLMVSLKKSLKENAGKLIIKEPSKAVMTATQKAGLSEYFNDD